MSVALTTVLVGCGLHLVTRTWLVMRFGWVGSDTYYHLMVGCLLRINRHLPFWHDRFIRSEFVDYPPLLPTLSSLWSSRRLRQLQFLGPISDFVTLLIVGVAAFWLQGAWAAAVAVIVYASTPYTFDMAYSLNPRPLANLFMTISIGSILLIDATGTPAVIGAGLAGGLVLLTHRLTTQSLAAALLAFAVVAPREILAVSVVAVTVAIGVSRGLYLTTLRGHIAFIRDLRTSRPPSLALARTTGKLLAGNPHVILIGFLATAQLQGMADQREVLWLAILVIALLALLWPFGEGDRHFANASSLTALTAGLGDWSGTSIVLLLSTVTAGTLIIVAKLSRYPALAKQGASTIATPMVRAACAAIVGETSGTRLPLVLTCPQALSYQVMFFAHARGVVASGGTGAGLAYNAALESRIQQSGLAGLREEEVPDFVLCLERNKPMGLEHGWTQIFDTDGVEAYRRDALRMHTSANEQVSPRA